MSLEPIKPTLPNVHAAISKAPKKHAKDNEDKHEHEEAQDKETQKKTHREKSSQGADDVHKILKKAVEAELPKVNILNEKGQKIVPDISGMVINILT